MGWRARNKQPHASRRLERHQKHLATKAARKTGQVAAHTSGKQTKRYRPGVVALKQIRYYQASTKLLIRRLPFVRMVRQITMGIKSDARFQSSALDALRESTENYIVDIYHDANLCAIHCNRVTVMKKDIMLVRKLRKRNTLR